MKTSKIKHRLLSLFASLLYVLSAGHPVLADDTEVLFGLGNQVNVLFIMDTSGSMGSTIAGENPTATDPSRLSIVQGVFADLMRNDAYRGFNIALMRFNGSNGGYFVTPMQELNAGTEAGIILASDTLTASGRTPLSDTLYEAARFWGGLSVDFGTGYNVDGVSSGGNYTSPITSQCQKNFTILLTDGEPNGGYSANNKVRDEYLGGTSCDGSGDGRCLDDIAGYLYATDQNASIAGDQTVETFTIGFTTEQQLLEETALAGGGTVRDSGIGNDHYFTANSAAELSAAFAEALGSTSTDTSFSPPALAANTFNGISHFNKLYFALFKPDTAPKWDGNVKPYALDDNYQLVDAAIPARPVVDANDGTFLEASRSFWSNVDDGGSIVEGGANGRLPTAAARTLYTYTDTYTNAGAPLTALSLLNDANTGLTANLLGPAGAITATQRSDIIDAARNFKLGAPLHSQPALVTYGGSDEATADLTLFVATNDGYLHALNANTGIERFAFIPKELLSNLPTLTNNAGTHPYGLDGDISVWVKESNDADKVIESSEGDHVYVYVGMRRGGNNYYALDVTDRDTPVLKWVIRGGANGTTGFEELGQTWSKPTLTSIKYNDGSNIVSRKVLIFGGGYDTRQDSNPLNLAPAVPDEIDSIGRAIFIVDADTGEKIWQTGNSEFNPDLTIAEMTHSIPSDVRLMDSNLDGHTDRLYVGDMRGQIFRIDLQPSTSGTGITGSYTVLASLSGDTEAENRRFYYPPDVVVTQRRGSAPYISVNIGSGYRAHPLNPVNLDGVAGPRVNDRFYSLRDPNLLGAAPANFSAISNAATDLLDLTNIPVLANSSALSNLDGWYITLGADNGEKVLAPSITINGEIFFTTYTPPAPADIINCQPPSGSGKVYRISLFDGSPIIPNSGIVDPNNPPAAPTAGDRSQDLSSPGIPSAPTAMFREDTNGNISIVACKGTQCDPLPNAIQMQKAYWQDGP